ncbi:MAG TPA: PrpF domain-containing protein [Actinomycetes bacterium]|nr:PrpF domain-containing protein [Actinomycetes bacterium]
MAENRRLRCSILRGGTSRGVFFHMEDLPLDRGAVGAVLLNVFGSPDVRQISGLGGATSQTSKAAMISPSSRPDADVDYTFAQVSVGTPVVDWGGNCGNLSSAVGPFAVDHGLVPAREGVTTVRIHNANTGKLIVAEVPVRDGRALVEGDYAIPGVPGTGARIDLEFVEPAGSVTGALLPTGRPSDEVRLADGRAIRVSVVDAANPVVFVPAAELGMRGTESPAEIEERTDVTDALEEIRGIVASWLGIVPDAAEATAKSPGLPKVGMVAPPAPYRTSLGETVGADAMDLCGRLMSMQTAHRSYMVTGAICTGAAAWVEGTVVHEASAKAAGSDRLRIAHPYGVMDVRVRAEGAGPVPVVAGVSVGRTARHILDGEVFVPTRLLDPAPALAAPA